MHDQSLDATNVSGKMGPALPFEAFSIVHALTHSTSTVKYTVLDPSILASFLKFWA